MLRDLHVSNLAVLASAGVEFGPGLNILTGETGAGKSIVVDSLALLAGARASAELIRAGTEQLTVTGLFEPAGEAWRETLAAAGIEAGGPELLIRREISREGRNRVYISDQPVTLRLLAELAPHLLRIHTQREELSLVAPELQRQWLDRVGAGEAVALRSRAATAWESYARLAGRLERARGDERARLERIDLLRFQAGEIDAARPRTGEDGELRAEREVLRHSEAIIGALAACHAELFEEEGAAVDRLGHAAQRLEEIAAWEPGARAWRDEVEELRIRLGELAASLRSRLEAVDRDPARLDGVEERLALLERLCRKYGATVADVVAYRERIGADLDELVGDEERREELAAAASAALAEYRAAAEALSRARTAWGSELAKRVHGELKDLAMGRARFAVALARRRRDGSPLLVDGEPVDAGPEGIDQATFTLAANPGEPPGPISRIASGGELSRVYLALQLAAGGDGPEASPTLVFDEVDAGVGGAEASALGRKLRRLAAGRQILAVTHLAQVASHADRHFRVAKRVSAGRTRVAVEALDADGQVQEVARMLAGARVTDLSRSHAEELIAAARRGSG